MFRHLECVKLPWIGISNHSVRGAGVVAAYYRYLDIYSATSHVIVIISATLWPRRGDESRWTPAPHHACSPVCACAVPGHYVAASILLQTNCFVFTPQFISSLNIKTYKYNVCLWYVKCEGDLYKSFSQFLVVDAKKEKKCSSYVFFIQDLPMPTLYLWLENAGPLSEL